MDWEGVEFIAGVSGHGFIKIHVIFPSSGCAPGMVCVLRAPVPDEMGKYDCFPLGNAFFYSLIKDLFYLCHLLCSCACGNPMLLFLAQTQSMEGDMGEHIGHLQFSDMGHPKLLGCSCVVFPGKPSQENFYLEQ